MNSDPRIKVEAKTIVRMLSERNYRGIVNYTNGAQLPLDEIEYAVKDYGFKIIIPPDYVFDDLDIIEVEKSGRKEWSVRCPLWTAEEGRSDLSIEMSMIEVSEKNDS